MHRSFKINLVQLLLGVPGNLKTKHYRTYHVALFGNLLAFTLHFIWLWTFKWLDVTSLFYFNIASSIFWTLNYFLLRTKGMVLTAMILGAIEVLSHQTFAIYILGWDYGFQYYFLAIVSYVCLGHFRRITLPLITIVMSFIIYLVCYYTIQHLLAPHIALNSVIQRTFYISNMLSVFFLVAIFSYIYSSSALKAEAALERERQKSEHLLLNILPCSIVQRLKEDKSVIADYFESTTVLFADIVGFTAMSAKIKPAELVQYLNKIFSVFDDLVEKYKLEKVKTIGDAYMVGGGFPEPRRDHVEAIADLALEMQNSVAEITTGINQTFDIRIGIHTGPAVAGVIGISKIAYDVWGDTVNTASRMESHGIPGQIQLSEQTYLQLKDKYLFKERGRIEIKGKEKMKTYLLLGKQLL